MDPGGVETWLMQVLRGLDRTRFRFDFLVHSPLCGYYDDEIVALGGRVLYCVGTSRPWKYGINFLKIIQEKGPYDVIHSHLHFFSGYVLWLANLAGIPRRIAHSHTTHDGRANVLSRHIYRSMMRYLLCKYATMGLGVSPNACNALFGPNWETDSRHRVLFCGIDIQPFLRAPQAGVMRRMLCLPQEAFVVGHVGRFAPEKNHMFLLEIASAVLHKRTDVWFLLVGDGPLRSVVEQKTRDLGIAHRFVFTGNHADVPDLMAAMNAFVLPSLYEGLSNVLIEAQAAGVPCVVSEAIPKEADVVPGAIVRLPLKGGAHEWMRALMCLEGRLIDRRAWLRAIIDSPFNLDLASRDLKGIYSGGSCF
jgi:glycosyltransferase involved in cell wall biosynthesis